MVRLDDDAGGSAHSGNMYVAGFTGRGGATFSKRLVHEDGALAFSAPPPGIPAHLFTSGALTQQRWQDCVSQLEAVSQTTFSRGYLPVAVGVGANTDCCVLLHDRVRTHLAITKLGLQMFARLQFARLAVSIAALAAFVASGGLSARACGTKHSLHTLCEQLLLSSIAAALRVNDATLQVPSHKRA